MLEDHLFEDVPDLVVLALEHLLGRLDRVRVAHFLEPANDEGLEELEGDLLGQTALVELELRADHDHRASRVVDALTEQVLAEATLLTLDHVRDRLQGAVVAAQDGAAAAAVVEEGVDRLLEHPLLVANDHVRRVEVEELLEAVVAVDQTTVEVVEVRGREAAALQQDEGAEVGRDHGDHVQDEPLGAVAALLERADRLEPLDEVLGLLLAVRLAELSVELLEDDLEVDPLEETLDGLGAHRGLEGVAVLLAVALVLLFGQELLLSQGRVTGVGDDEVLEVDHPLQAAGLLGQERAEATREGLEEPNVGHGRGQVDVTHALAAHPAVGDLDAAAVALDPLVLDALVLAAGALPVPLRAEDPLTEQTLLLRAIGPVVDRLWLLDLAIRPGPNVVGAREANRDALDFVLTSEVEAAT